MQTKKVDHTYSCPTCKDEGGWIEKRDGVKYLNKQGEWVIMVDDVWVDCVCAKVRRTKSLLKSSAITPGFQQKGFQNFQLDGKHPEIQQMYKLAYSYYQDFNADDQASILFSGQPGSGKTHLLCAVANNLMTRRMVPVMYFPWVEGMSEAAANNFEKKVQVTERMKRVDVLFIDDLFKPALGKHTVYDWQIKMLYEVLNHRYMSGKPIMVSSELSMNDMVLVDEGTATRIFEMAGTNVVALSAGLEKNYRLRAMLGGAQ